MHQPLSFSEYSTIVRTNVCINSFPELFIFPYIISNSKRKSRNFSITTISRMILNRFLRFHNQHAVSRTQEIHERHLAAVPFPFPGFLPAPFIVWTRISSRLFSTSADSAVMVSFLGSLEESIPSSAQSRFTP